MILDVDKDKEFYTKIQCGVHYVFMYDSQGLFSCNTEGHRPVITLDGIMSMHSTLEDVYTRYQFRCVTQWINNDPFDSCSLELFIHCLVHQAVGDKRRVPGIAWSSLGLRQRFRDVTKIKWSSEIRIIIWFIHITMYK